MPKLTVRSSAFAALVATLAVAPACSKHNEPTTAERAEIAQGTMRAAEALTVTVQSVDPANQTVFLRDEQGNRFAVQTDSATVQRLQPEDRIKVRYQEMVGFALQEKDEPEQKTKVEDLTQVQGDNGIQLGRKISTTVEILSVSEKGASVEFRTAEGSVRTVAIDDPGSREKVQALRKGDKVAVTYVEKLALALDEADQPRSSGMEPSGSMPQAEGMPQTSGMEQTHELNQPKIIEEPTATQGEPPHH